VAEGITLTPSALFRSRLRRVLGILVFALGVSILARHCAVGYGEITRTVADLRARGLLLRVAGGDVALRDIPKAQELRAGRFFTDPYYQGEAHWYPFGMPAVAAALSWGGGYPLPEAYFRLEVLTTALYLAAAAWLAFVVAGWTGLVVLPAFVWAGWLGPGNGLYPGEGARGLFCGFLAYAAIFLGRRGGDPPPARSETIRWSFVLGLLAGTLGLWTGASFFAALAVTGALLVHAALTARRDGHHRQNLLALGALAAGVCLPMLLLFGPQLAHYGTLRAPGAARTWLAELYNGGSYLNFLRLDLLPRGVPRFLVLALFLRLIFGHRMGLARWPRAVPAAFAYTFCLLLAHTGYLLADGRHPVLKSVVRAVLPAPPHTFHALAEACLPVVMAGGALSVVEILARLIRRQAWSERVGLLAAILAGILATIGYAVTLVKFPYSIKRYSSTETIAFDRDARRLGQAAAGATVFFRYPGRFVQSTSIKIVELSVHEYANHYVHAERQRAVAAIDQALQAGDVGAADRILDEYQVVHVVDDPRARTDAVIRKCGGDEVAQADGYILRKRTPCRR
jgi:hypothetical protein